MIIPNKQSKHKNINFYKSESYLTLLPGTESPRFEFLLFSKETKQAMIATTINPVSK